MSGIQSRFDLKEAYNRVDKKSWFKVLGSVLVSTRITVQLTDKSIGLRLRL